MKKLIASILTVLTVVASAQLTYVNTLDYSLTPPSKVSLSDKPNLIDNDKYLIGSRNYFQVGEYFMFEYYDILNPDFSIYKTISIDTAGWRALSLRLGRVFFSNHLYNSDDKIEVTYSISKKALPNHWYAPFKTVVINEDGIELQTIDNFILNDDCIFQVDGRTYLQGSNEAGETVIYEAGGTLPCKTCSSSESTSNKKAPEKVYDINVFPNPTSNQITLAINTDKTGMKVHIYSIDGKLVKSASVVNGNNLIDTADLVSGTYIYNVLTDNELIHASQFIKK